MTFEILIKLCLDLKPENRPTATEVLYKILKILEMIWMNSRSSVDSYYCEGFAGEELI